MELTIDELASRSGVPSSTIRLYQTRGLLPKPRREGRVGRYGPAHVARLELIGQLQERGWSLAAIGELVDTWEEGRTLDEVLGLEQRTVEAFAAPEPLDLDVGELLSRFPAGIGPTDVTRAVELGLAEMLPDGRVRLHSPEFLEVGAALVALGIPLAEVYEEQVHLRQVLEDVAHRFARLFERHVWRPFADAGMPADRLADVQAALDRLAPLARQIVLANLGEALRTAAGELLGAEAERLRH
ncbi:MAG: MerR family transcriptional regulator [Actinomycetota bacterium]